MNAFEQCNKSLGQFLKRDQLWHPTNKHQIGSLKWHQDLWRILTLTFIPFTFVHKNAIFEFHVIKAMKPHNMGPYESYPWWLCGYRYLHLTHKIHTPDEHRLILFSFSLSCPFFGYLNSQIILQLLKILKPPPNLVTTFHALSTPDPNDYSSKQTPSL